MLAAGTACGSGSESTPASGTGGITTAGNAGVAGNSAGSGGTGTPAAAGTGGASNATGGSAEGGVGGSTGGVAQGGSPPSGEAAAGAGAGGAPLDPCPEAPTPRLASGTVVEFPLELTFDGAPLQVAEANPLPGGGTLTPLSARFYISEVALLRESGEPLPVDVVTSAGTVAPYGIHFFNADDDSSTTLRVLAPVGEYQGVTFLWGLALSCNRRHPAASSPPLTATSQMSWPHGGGYLFFRYEGRTASPGEGGAGGGGSGPGGARLAGGTSSAGGVSSGGANSGGAAGTAGAGTAGGAGGPSSTYPSVIHMGGNVTEALAPLIRLEGALSVSAGGSVRKGVRVAMEEIFEGALADVDLTGFVGAPAEETIKGERLRRSMAELTVFSFEP